MGMKTCCFCFDLKNGTSAVGVFTLTINLLAVLSLGIVLGLLHKTQSGNQDVEVVEIIYGVAIGLCSLNAIFSIMLIIGVQKNIRGLFIPWMVITVIGIGSSMYWFFGSLVLISEWGWAIVRLFSSLIGTVFASYMLWCVCAYYKSLSSQSIPYENFANEANQNQKFSPAQLEKDDNNIA